MDNIIVLYIILYLIFGFFEMRFGVEKGHTLSNKLLNIFYGTILLISGAVLVGLIYTIIPFKPRLLPYRGRWVSILIALVYIFLSDFVFYWYHRAMHSFKYLWVLHELHHSDTQLNVTTSLRTYWLDRPIQALLNSIPITYIIGFDSVAIKIWLVLLTVWLFFTHSNLKLRFGFLTRILGGPQLHRVHHSNLPEHQGKNLAQIFPIFDILFGTYYHPGYNEFPTTGLTEKNTDGSISEVMTKPFVVWFGLIFSSRKKL